MRRLLIVLTGLAVWGVTNLALAQQIAWDRLAHYFRFTDEIRLSIDPQSLESFANWEEPDLPLLPEKWLTPLLRPYFEKTHPGHQSDADWERSEFYQANWYAYSIRELEAGGLAAVLLNEDKSGPYLLMLTFDHLGRYQHSLLLYADYHAQGGTETCRSHWTDSATLLVARMSSWELFHNGQLVERQDTLVREYDLHGDGRLQLLKGEPDLGNQ
jgi:hypothetical protein